MFKESFKRYKSKDSPPNLKDVVDVDQPEKFKELTPQVNRFDLLHQTSHHESLHPPAEWRVFTLSTRPGFLFVRNPFTEAGQRHWIRCCLRDYTKAPNPNNLATKQLNETVIADWWSALCRTKDRRRLRESLRWTTLGYHHDWDTKVYRNEGRNEFPPDLADLVRNLAQILGFTNYRPEAAIVNFYPVGSTLAGHTDHSEYCEEPLFSISFGQPAIFLLGGRTKEEKPTAILLRSGDVVVMSKESRLCYHAVPRVFKMDKMEAKSWGWDENSDWKDFEDYLELSRINVNVRQVFMDKRE